MGFLDRLLGRDEQPDGRDRSSGGTPRERSADEVAVERYRYLLRTAPPERIEEVHLEAFRKLTPEQREILFRQLSSDAAEGDAPVDDRPESLARSATRSEMRAPGTLERTLGPRGGLAGGGGGGGGGLVLPDRVRDERLRDGRADHDADGGADAGADGVADAGATDAGGADAGAGDFGSGDFGAGDFGGGADMGGGDFGGGDFF